MAKNGIFCLETIWLDELKSPATRLLLELLERLSDIPFVYRDVSTREELNFYLGRWCGRNMYREDYRRLGHLRVLYLGFHGLKGQISLRADLRQKSDDDSVDLRELMSMIKPGQNDATPAGRVIHFASCSVMRSRKHELENFKEEVGASCVSGYTKSIDYAPSWAFELMYLDLLSSLDELNTDTLRDLDQAIKEQPEYSGLAKKLGFRMIF